VVCIAYDAGFSAPTGAGLCAACADWTYAASPGAAACTDCLQGSFLQAVGSAGAIACQECPANANTTGTLSAALASCVCNPGSFGAGGLSACVLCVLDKFQPHVGGQACELCPAGTYLGASGSVVASDCAACARGKFSAAVGATAELTCSACPVSTFLGAEGGGSEDACQPCPANTNTTVVASVGAANCVCNPGSAGAGGGLACVLCAPGA